MATGKIGVTTENIFPVIKKFLYSDHEIFLRELVSNAIDASQKLRTLASVGEFKGELGDLKVTVSLDKEAGTLTVSDNGIGLTAEEIDKYINQIAFSGAEEFLAKYKDAEAIIGHFGLGFYSAFMVSDKVEIHSLSFRDGAKVVRWSCDGSPEYTIEDGTRTTRGTDIILHIDKDSTEFLERDRIEALLRKYCRFLPVPVVFGKKQEWKDGKMQDTDEDNVINSVEPKWMKKPADLTDDDYRSFYHTLYPTEDDPLFWIHLNVDFPFTLTGILYFPKIKNNIEIQKNRIQLYCNQVFVTDSVEGVVPDFMMLLQGVIDSPDIPLNVSRSYLQSDANVKKISSYITKKVYQRLEELFKADRANFESKWNDIRIFIQYGMLTDEKFCEASLKYLLLQDTNDKFFTVDEYKTLIDPNQTDKDGNRVVLYSTDSVAQYTYIRAAEDRGYSVLRLDGQLDSHFVGLMEQKLEKTRFVRVDADVIDNLIPKDNARKVELTPVQRVMLQNVFQSQLPELDKANFLVSFEALAPTDMPIVITQNEFMRRMKDMSALQPGMSFYGEMPDSYNLVINTSAPIIESIGAEAFKALEGQFQPLEDSIAAHNAEIDEHQKSDDHSAEAHKQIDNLRTAIDHDRDEEKRLATNYAANVPQVRQLIDLALLGNGLLRGRQLSDFIARSVSLIK